ncbi:AmmeMemoRadiSam system protein B [Corynebacterium sp. 335C]
MTRIRPPAVAGLFYPADPDELRATVDGLLAAAAGHAAGREGDGGDARPGSHEGARPVPLPAPRAVVAPHAGLRYSGGLAAIALNEVDWSRATHAVVCGPAHRVPVRGVALPGADALRTPLGDVPVPADVVDRLREELGDLLVVSPGVHRDEHCVEVELPLIQMLAPGLPVVTLVAGDATPEQMARLAAAVLADPGAVYVVSTDLSHFLPQEQARRVDDDTLDRVLRLDGPLPPRRACGAVPLNGLVAHAREAGLAPELLAARTSADVPDGDPRRVVGYAALRFDELGTRLPAVARAAIAEALGAGSADARDDGTLPGADPAAHLPAHPWLAAPGAAFVTLTAGGRLRGCIGSLEPRRPLLDDVRANAVAAAVRDPRFPPLTAGELDGVSVEVSVLTPPEPVPGVRSAADAAAALRPGVDGATLTAGARRGTFLPQVWEQLPEPRDFVDRLVVKAGLPPGTWPEGARLERYGVRAWSE